MREELEAHLADPAVDEQTKKFKESVEKQKDRWASKSRPEKADFMTQVCTSDFVVIFINSSSEGPCGIDQRLPTTMGRQMVSCCHEDSELII